MSVRPASTPDSLTPPMDLPTDLELETPLWQFAQTFWQLAGVQDCCLALQDQGWSVTRILCAAWLARSGQAFNGREDATVTEWRDRVTGALRGVRKSLPRHADCYQKLRTGAAGLELEAERIELALCWRTLMTQTTEHVERPGGNTLFMTNIIAASPTLPMTDRAQPLVHRLADALADHCKENHQP